MRTYILTLAFIFLGSAVCAQFSSKNDNKYFWGQHASWTGGVSPGPIPNNANITINGLIECEYSLLLENNANILIQEQDTLVILGNAEFTNSATVNIMNNAVLLVIGDVTVKNNFTFNNMGKVVVTGDFESENNAAYLNTDAIYTFGNFSPNENKTSYNGPSVGNEADFNTDEPQPFIDFVYGYIVLPIELSYLDAFVEEQKVVVEWSSSEEENFSHYQIERSVDGTDFQTLGRVEGNNQGVTTSEYYFLDEAPQNGYNYYRLRAVDLDKKENVLGPVFVEYRKPDRVHITVFPTQVENGHINVNFDFQLPEQSWVTLVASNGQVVSETELDNSQNSIKLSVDDLNKGIYFVKYNTEDSVITKRFVKH